MTNNTRLLLGLIVASGISVAAVAADASAEQRQLAKAIPQATITLQQGLAAGGTQGSPISGKYELEEGHLQLSVYTALKDQYREVVVDHKTGKTVKTEAITEADDLAAAKAQSAAMAGAKLSLSAAVDNAEHSLPGYRAISVIPQLRKKHVVAAIRLVKGATFKSVTQALD